MKSDNVGCRSGSLNLLLQLLQLLPRMSNGLESMDLHRIQLGQPLRERILERCLWVVRRSQSWSRSRGLVDCCERLRAFRRVGLRISGSVGVGRYADRLRLGLLRFGSNL